jgi:hypothetical protein
MMKERSKRFSWRVIVIALTTLLVWVFYLILWNGSSWRTWTGFGDFTSPTGEYHHAKTLWDWMSLLIVPAALASGAWVLNKWQADRERDIARRQGETDREMESERQGQTMFEAYLDQMTLLLLEKGLRQREDCDEVKTIARARTLTLLNALDGVRKGQVIKFLFEANLLTRGLKLIDLKNANLEDIHLVWADLTRIDLTGSHLSRAQLKFAHLEDSNLTNTTLVKADLRRACLQRCNLKRANLAWADLRGASLEAANLEEAHLEGAQLLDAKLTGAILQGVRYNQHTRWPDGFEFSRTGVINVDIHKDKADFFPGDGGL